MQNASGHNYKLTSQSQYSLQEKEQLIIDFYQNILNDFDSIIWMAKENRDTFFFNRSFIKYFNCCPNDLCGDKWKSRVYSEDLTLVMATYMRAFKLKSKYNIEYRVIKDNGEIGWLSEEAKPVLSSNDKVLCFIGFCTDVTEKKKEEERLLADIKLKDLYLKEIRHRFKNGLQLISSFLNLQLYNNDNKTIYDVITESNSRIKALSILNDIIFKEEFTSHINVKDYFEQLVSYFQSSSSYEFEFTINTKIMDVNLKFDKALPLGLILFEVITNSLKHAFINRESNEINILFYEKGANYHLVIKDNGCGLKNENLDEIANLGFQIIRALAFQLRANLEIFSDEGTTVKLIIKKEFLLDGNE